MQRRDWLVTGLRLVGIFVVVQGLAGVAQAIAWMGVEAWGQGQAGALPGEFRLGFNRLPHPLVEALLGFAHRPPG